MARPVPTLLIYALTVASISTLVWLLAHDRRSQPYTVRHAMLSGWTIVEGTPDDPWVVAARPPDVLVNSLRQQIEGKFDRPLTRVPRVVLPLVLRQEFEDSLQGIYGTARLMRFAEDALMNQAAFEPVCIAHRTDPQHGELLFVAFNVREYWQFRADIEPFQPEQAGSGVFDPAALSPVLPLATSGADFGYWWPITIDPLTDCQAPLLAE